MHLLAPHGRQGQVLRAADYRLRFDAPAASPADEQTAAAVAAHRRAKRKRVN